MQYEHEDAIALPNAAVDVPDYLHSIITLCRQEDARNRQAAWEPIHMFPEDEEIFGQINPLEAADKIAVPEAHNNSAIMAAATAAALTRLELARALYGIVITCNLCGERYRDSYYPCVNCDFGNFHKCHRCFVVEGKHCRDRAHLLARVSLEDVTLASEKSVKKATYYSSGDEKGEREDTVF